MLYRSARLACALLLTLTLAGAAGAAPRLAASLPAGFADALVAEVPAPTALAFASATRMLVASQAGQLRVVQNGQLLGPPALDLAAAGKVCTNSERGLLGVVVDPDFASNHFIYLYYTYKKFGVCPTGDPTNPQVPVNRVARYTLSDANVASGETVLVDNMLSPNGNHNGGDLHFGQDGYLYISVGDGGSDYAGDSGGAGANDAARDEFMLLGKILRITRDGGIPPGNPFVGAGSTRCNAAGRTSAGNRCQETFAWGLRNPFRFAFKPGTSQFLINDVGQNAWEEIDQGQAGADYGWSCREGKHPNQTGAKCAPTPPNMIDPIYEYDHSECASITGGAFVPDGVWPAEYQGAYLFADYVCGTIFVLRGQASQYVADSFATNLSGPTSLTFGPYGGGQALYYTSYEGGGQVRRIVSTASANRSPTAAIAASPTYGAAPLTVGFDAAGSGDPDGDALSYEWSFGDGSPHSAAKAPTHQYASGTYIAELTVRDGRGGSDTATMRIDSGNFPPAPQISAPGPGLRFAVGQSITLVGAATDPEDGALPPARLSWRVLLHHNTHTHPFVPPTPGASVSFSAPGPEDLAATSTSYLEAELTATDSRGLTSVITRELRPALVQIELASDPPGRTLTVNGQTLTAPGSVTSWPGYLLSVSSPGQRDESGRWVIITGWADGPSAATRAISTPAADTSYTAIFGPAKVFFLPAIRR